MAIASLKPIVGHDNKNDLPRIEPDSYKSIVTDSKYVPYSSLLVFVEGSIWTCNFYTQVTNRDSDLRVQDPTQSPVYQQYNKIVKLELKVDSPLSTSQEDDTKFMVVTGSAYINPFSVPQAGDMFIADVGNGNDALFVINNTERKSMLKDSVFLIEYTLIDYVKNIEDRILDLENKVINTTFFRKDYALKGQNPFLTKTENEEVISLDVMKDRLISYYFDEFYNYELSTLVLPGQAFYIYDHYVMDFVTKLVDTFDSDKIRLLRKLNIDGDVNIKKPTLYSALLKWDNNILKNANRYMGTTYSKAFNKDPMLEGIAYSGVALVVYPVTPDTFNLPLAFINSGNMAYTDDIRYSNYVNDSGMLSGDYLGLPLSDITPVNELALYGSINIAGVNTPIAKPIGVDTSYVLSNSFYDGLNDMSVLEALVCQYLNTEALDKSVLLKVCLDYSGWSRLDKFYYIPILILLIKYSSRR